MKKSRESKRKSAVTSAAVRLPGLPAAPVALVLDEMVKNLQGIAKGFDKPTAVQVQRLIKLTTAFRDQVCGEWSGTETGARRRKMK